MWHACRFQWADDGHAKSRVEVDGWLYDTQSGERPLIAQLCAVSPDEFIYAAKQLEPFVDGIDLNRKPPLLILPITLILSHRLHSCTTPRSYTAPSMQWAVLSQ